MWRSEPLLQSERTVTEIAHKDQLFRDNVKNKRRTEMKPTFRAHRYEELAGKYRHLAKLAHDAGKKMLLPVHPGHDNSHFVAEPYAMPRRDGQTLRDYLRSATDAGADFIMVTSWNEWPESTVIEPSSSWPDPYLYLRILADWRGLTFTAPPLPSQERQQP